VPDLPAPIAAAVAGAALGPIDPGRARAEVWRVERDGRVDAVVKRTAPADEADPWAGGAVAEAERLRWLAGRAAVPEVRAVHVDADGAGWLLTGALPGTDATDVAHHGDVERLVAAVGRGLRRFHDEVPVAACPFDTRLEVRLAAARARIAAGRVDPDDFEPLHRGRRPEDLVELVESLHRDDEDLVVVHGDPSLPNVVLGHGEVVGWVDVGRSGVADRYLDLAIVARSVARNVGASAVGPLFDAYGVDWPDVRRIECYTLLDELF
jgi:aminoglycoside 3'-phosphotransferase-2